jgi:NAD(P)-dependent dehydrogenase (short-subunit alcohol dehydrogenase family)
MRFVVTGAASGIGAATTDALLGGGHTVVAVDRIAPKSAAEFVACDLADPEAIRRACDAIQGPLDGLANVAGLPGTHPGDLVMKVNYLGYRALMEGLTPQLRDGASVVSVATTAAKHCSWDAARLANVLALGDWEQVLEATEATSLGGVAAYCNSKRLVTAMMPGLVKAGLPRKLRYNAVSPGITATPILQDFKDSFGADRIEVAASAVGGLGRPEAIASAICWLLLPASDWVNGVDLTVDGGLQALRDAA